MQLIESPYFCYNRRVVLYYIGIVVCFIFSVGFFVNLVAAFFYIPDNLHQIKCTETTCLLSVFKNICYAKFEFYPGVNWESVKCHDHKGYYNTTVPCNTDNKTGKPIIYCEERYINRHLYGILFALLVLSQLLFMFCSFGTLLNLISSLVDYLKTLTPIGDKIEDPDPKLVELNDA